MPVMTVYVAKGGTPLATGGTSFPGTAMNTRKTMAKLCAAALILSYGWFLPQAGAFSRMLTIMDTPTNEDMALLRKYFAPADPMRDRIKTLVFGDLKIFRLESSGLCQKTKCLTVVIQRCGEDNCPSVSIFAEDTVYNSDVSIDLLGGVNGYAFARPGEPGIAVLVGKKSLAIISIP